MIQELNNLYFYDDIFNAETFVGHYRQRIGIINDIASGTESVLDPSQSIDMNILAYSTLPKAQRNFLGRFSSDPEITKAIVINALAVKEKKRKSGRLYAGHPHQVATTILLLATDVSPEILKRSLLISELHDVIEEDTLRAYLGTKSQGIVLANVAETQTPNGVIDQARRSINELFMGEKLGDAIVHIMEPLVPQRSMEKYLAHGADKYLIKYSYFAELLKKSNDPALINAEISDRIDDILELDYILKSNSPEQKKQQRLLDKFGKCFFTITYITQDSHGSLTKGVSPQLVSAFNVLLETVISQQKYVTREQVEDRSQDFDMFIRSSKHEIIEDLNEFLNSIGISLL